jgi:hypothetical protein
MRQLKYKGDIESDLADMETQNYKVCPVGTPWRFLPRDELTHDIQYQLSADKGDSGNDMDYVESVRRVGRAMERILM